MLRGILTTISVYSVGIIVVVAGFFLLGIEKITINYWAFGSLLFSLIISLFAMITLVVPHRHKDRTFYTAGLTSVILLYEIAVVISIIFIKPFTERLNNFIFLQVTINALFFIAAITIITASSRIYDNKVKTYKEMQSGENDKPRRGDF